MILQNAATRWLVDVQEPDAWGFAVLPADVMTAGGRIAAVAEAKDR
jgi:hypothetical protein